MEFNKKVPEWSAEGTEPPESLKTSGFQGGYKPPASYFNWFWHGVSACLNEIREKLLGHATNKENPHGVTAAHLGLDKVNNTADSEKNVKFASEAAAARKVQYDLVVRFNGGGAEGTSMWTYNGSTSRSVNITPDKIGAAKADMSNVDAEKFREVMVAAGGGGIPIVAAASADGVAYTATVEGVTELTNGLLVTIIPEITSTSTAITLNVNGLGAKMVRLPLSFNNAAMASPKLNTYYTAGRPLTLQYDAAYLANDGIWKVYGKQKTSAQDLYGSVPVESGGTGADNAADARANLGAAAKSQAVTLTVAASAWTGEGPYTATVACNIATASNNLEVGYGGTITEDEFAAMAGAAMFCTGQAEGSITLTAFGEKPEIDLPVNVLEVG